MARETPSTHTREPQPRLVAAAHLLAAAEAARRLRNGDELDDVARYVRIRAERLAREHAGIYAALARVEAPDPLDMARGIDPDLAAPATPRAAAPQPPPWQPTEVTDSIPVEESARKLRAVREALA